MYRIGINTKAAIHFNAAFLSDRGFESLHKPVECRRAAKLDVLFGQVTAIGKGILAGRRVNAVCEYGPYREAALTVKRNRPAERSDIGLRSPGQIDNPESMRAAGVDESVQTEAGDTAYGADGESAGA